MTKVVAIHQPNFFPWIGYFEKICRADTFIFLDDVQYQKTGGSWSNRVKVLLNGKEFWLTAPLDRNFHGTRNVNEMNFSNKEDWRSKMLKTLVLIYKRAPFFNEIFPIIKALIENPENNVAVYNINAIKALASILGYSTDSMIRSSSLPSESLATERLIELTLHMDGKAYLCGGGAAEYQEDEAFLKARVKLQYQNFSHPIYPQFGSEDFVAGLSIIDPLMNLGFEGVRKLLKRNA